MKSFTIVFVAIFVTMTAFSQQTNNNTDTAITAYLKYSCLLHPQYVSNVPAKCPVCNSNMSLSKKEQMKMGVMKLYTCPMDHVISTQAGKCPVCKMDMVVFDPRDKANKN